MKIALITILGLLFVAYVGFAIRYARHSPWRATWQGITLEAQKITMASLVGYFLADTLIPGDWGGARYALLYVLLGLLLIEAWATLLGLLHVQQAHRPVSKRQGTGFAHPEDIERTDQRRRYRR